MTRPAEPTTPGDLAGRTLLIVNPGSERKRFILQKLKRLGLRLVILNSAENWARPYADRWILADLSRPAACVEAVRAFCTQHPDWRPDGALTYWEDSVLLAARVGEELGWICTPHAVASLARNKLLFREFCRANRIPAPGFARIHGGAPEEIEGLKFPLVLKPAFGAGSAFVTRVDNREEYERAVAYIRAEISERVESALADGLEIMAEEYLTGEEVDIDIIVQNGRFKFASISDNNETREPFFVETGQNIPSRLPEKARAALLDMAAEVLEKMGVRDSCVHFEARIERGDKGDDRPFPIEVNLRMGGDEVYSFVKAAWGYDLVVNAARVALGIYIPPFVLPAEPRQYLAGRYFLPEKSGVLSRLDVDPALKTDRALAELHIFKKIGDTVLVPPLGFETLGWVSVWGATPGEAEDELARAMALVRFEVAGFHPASSIGKTKRSGPFHAARVRRRGLLRSSRIERVRRNREQRSLHIGIACNSYDAIQSESEVEQELANVGRNIMQTLRERGYQTSFFDFNHLPETFQALRSSGVDLVFNVCERINDSSLLEPHAASVFDMLQIPYTGSNPFTLGLCIDKIRVKKLLAYHNIPTPRWDYAYTLGDDIDSTLKFPLIVKPANTDNSIGITNDSVVTDAAGLRRQLEWIIGEVGRPALVEEYIEGDEYDVSILGNDEDDRRVLPLSRSSFADMPGGYWHIYPFEAKFAVDAAYKDGIRVERPPKKIPARLAALISEIALDTYAILGCHDYGRVEIRVDAASNPYVLELNPNPSINRGDCLPEVGALVGLDYGDFLEEIIASCLRRYRDRPPFYHLQTAIL